MEKRLRYLLLLLLLLALPARPAAAQKKEGRVRLDSLLARLPRLRADTSGVNLLADVANAYSRETPAAGLPYARRVLALARMRDHAQEVLPPAGLDVQFRVPPGLPDPELAPDLLHHLYLIYKEALHNVVKRAQAITVTVRLADALAGLTLTLTVADDGRGHDGCPRPGGHGLGNMQARAQAVGGTVRYEPQPAGFAVVVNLPLG